MTYGETEAKDRVQKIHCETCDDLLEYLRPSHDQWLAAPAHPRDLIKTIHQVMVARRDWLEHIAALPAVPPDMS